MRVALFIPYIIVIRQYYCMFLVEIKDTVADVALNPPAHCRPDHSVISKILHCKFQWEDHVQSDIKNSTLAVVSFDVQPLPGCHLILTIAPNISGF